MQINNNVSVINNTVVTDIYSILRRLSWYCSATCLNEERDVKGPAPRSSHIGINDLRLASVGMQS